MADPALHHLILPASEIQLLARALEDYIDLMENALKHMEEAGEDTDTDRQEVERAKLLLVYLQKVST